MIKSTMTFHLQFKLNIAAKIITVYSDQLIFVFVFFVHLNDQTMPTDRIYIDFGVQVMYGVIYVKKCGCKGRPPMPCLQPHLRLTQTWPEWNTVIITNFDMLTCEQTAHQDTCNCFIHYNLIY